MKVLAYFILTCLLLWGDEVVNDEFASKPHIVDPNGKEYFPEDSENWYGKHLLAMKEPSLLSSNEEKDREQYRFLCLPTFSKPICFRACKMNGIYTIRVVRLSGRGGYEPGKIELDATIEITEKEWHELRTNVSKVFNGKQITEQERFLLGGLDGTQWILEARIKGAYKFQEVWGAEYWISKAGMEVLGKLDGAEGDQYELLYLKVFSFHHACRGFLDLSDMVVPQRINPPVSK